MAYNKQNWSDGPGGGTPLNAARLNRMEDGIAAAAVLADVANAATPTGAVLGAAYTAAAAPTYVAPRGKQFDPARSVYNLKASNTRKTRAKAAQAKVGTGLWKITCAGDSLTAGMGSTVGTTDYPTALRELLAAQGYSVGSGLIYPSKNLADPRWTLGTWTLTATSAFISRSGSNVVATLTVPNPGTVVDVVTYGNTAAFSVSIDGASQGTIVPNGQQAVQVISYTGLANTAHTVAITTATGNNFLVAAGVRNPTGVQVTNAGLSGAKTGDWYTTGVNAWFSPLNTALGTGPDTMLLELGMNTETGGATTLKTNLTTIVQTVQGAGVDVLLCASHSPSTNGSPGGFPSISTTEFNTRLNAIYDVADTCDVPLLDMTDRVGLFAQSSANGLTSDALHLNGAGYAEKARAWASVLSA